MFCDVNPYFWGMYEPKDSSVSVHLTSHGPLLAAAELLAQLGICKGAILQRNSRTAGSSVMALGPQCHSGL